MEATILIAEDDRALRESLAVAVGLDGHSVELATDGAKALEYLRAHQPDLIILDVSMPYVDGLTVARTVRSNGAQTPILMLTARDAVTDRVAGLDAGADDYLVKPFALEELRARIRALLRRTTAEESEAMTVGPLSVDPARRSATISGDELDLTKTEFDLLELMVNNQGIVLARETIYDRIWGYEFEPSSKLLDVHISYLRRKLEADDRPRLLKTVRGVGFVLEPM